MSRKNTGYSGDGTQTGYVSNEIKKGLDRMEEQIERSKETLKKSRSGIQAVTLVIGLLLLSFPVSAKDGCQPIEGRSPNPGCGRTELIQD